MSYLDWIKQQEQAKVEARSPRALGDAPEAGDPGEKSNKYTKSPDRSLPGLEPREPVAESRRKVGAKSPEPLEVRPLPAPPLLPDGLEASWRALSAPDDLFPDQPGECSVCGAEVECYGEDGTPWCMRCAPLCPPYRPVG